MRDAQSYTQNNIEPQVLQAGHKRSRPIDNKQQQQQDNNNEKIHNDEFIIRGDDNNCSDGTHDNSSESNNKSYDSNQNNDKVNYHNDSSKPHIRNSHLIVGKNTGLDVSGKNNSNQQLVSIIPQINSNIFTDSNEFDKSKNDNINTSSNSNIDIEEHIADNDELMPALVDEILGTGSNVNVNPDQSMHSLASHTSMVSAGFGKAKDAFHYFNGIRLTAGRIVNDERVQTFIIFLIVVNAIMMGIGTFSFVLDEPNIASIFETIDKVFLIIFTIELAIQFTYFGYQLFFDGWLVFDLFIITLSWAFENVQIIRAFRIFRALRLITRIEVMKNLVLALFSVMPRMAAIGLLLLIIFYIFAVMFTTMFKDLWHDGETDDDYFSRLDSTLFTLFQLMTMDNWASIARQCMAVYTWAWAPIIAFLVITGFIVVNLIIAVICDAVAALDDGEKDALHGTDAVEFLLSPLGLHSGDSSSESSNNGEDNNSISNSNIDESNETERNKDDNSLPQPNYSNNSNNIDDGIVENQQQQPGQQQLVNAESSSTRRKTAKIEGAASGIADDNVSNQLNILDSHIERITQTNEGAMIMLTTLTTELIQAKDIIEKLQKENSRLQDIIDNNKNKTSR